MTPRTRAGERGAALLTAMVIVTLVATLAAAMVWQQWRAVQVEAAERARSQSHWILVGAVDWARLILREDAATGGADHLGEPWAVPLAEAKLSTFLAVDRENTDDAPEAFLSGSIVDAQARYNLRNLAESGPQAEVEQRILQRLLDAVGVRPDLGPLLAQAVRDAAPQAPTAPASAASGSSQEDPVAVVRAANPPLMPERISQLGWLGVDAASLARLAPYVVLLPARTPVNVNTASKEVLAAVLGVDLASAERLVQARQRGHFSSLDEARALLPEGSALDERHAAVASSYFEVRGRLRLEDRVIEQRALVERRGRQIVTLHRERVAAVESDGS
ncbi:MAG TPA: type II secretion system minor pseudopilin GspK [Methylibium sp.]|nr:type II secretion system minor pseudopilin GspK [Methylibium sp.]